MYYKPKTPLAIWKQQTLLTINANKRFLSKGQIEAFRLLVAATSNTDIDPDFTPIIPTNKTANKIILKT